MRSRDLLIATGLVFAVLVCARPDSLWEFDEVLFAHAVQHYAPLLHHPPPPGYPLFIFAAKMVRLVTPSDFAALVALNIVASTIAFAFFALAFGRMTDRVTGIVAALFFAMSPALLVHSPIALSEPGALALLAVALFFVPSSPPLFAACAALSIGWRPQMCLFIVPLLLVSLLLRRDDDRLQAVRALCVFAVVCLLWFVPLAISVGGIEKLIGFETAQARYVAQHDADVSRTAWKPAAMLIQFVSHAWGPRVMALPVLLAAAAGAWKLRRSRAVYPLAIAGGVYIAVALAIMDPADGVRYAIPFQLVVALFAGVGAMAFTRRFGHLVTQYETAIVFAIGSIIYVSSFVAQRAWGPSPPVRAAAAIPRSAAVGYEMSLWPHSTYFLRDHAIGRIDAAVQRTFDTPRVPLYEFVNGTSYVGGARTFQWENSDAYWNLTRNLYRIVSIAPLGPERRFRIIRGVHLLEREDPAGSWRWIDADAAITAPHALGIDLFLVLPRSAPYPANRITIEADGRVVGSTVLERGKPHHVHLRFPSPASIVRFRAEQSFRGPNDPRRLAFAMLDLRYRLR